MKAAGHFSKATMDEAQSYLPSLTLERRALKKIYKKTKFDSKHMTRMMNDIGEMQMVSIEQERSANLCVSRL